MNTKLLNELELHLHNSELALQLARKAAAELKAETLVAEISEHAGKVPCELNPAKTEPIDFYAKLEGEHYSNKPCSTDTREPKTFLHRKLLEKRLPFQTLLAGLRVTTVEDFEFVYDTVFEDKYRNYREYRVIRDFIENYKQHGEV